ncbi:MAG: hypothetical protein LBG80_19045 [Bacteroidales bacterium]|jgi:hypothetical protein|nr:hypothetical protein [Bacteroidales bacterium]
MGQNRKNNTGKSVFLRINNYTTPSDIDLVNFYKDYSYHERGDTDANTRIHSKSDVDYDTFKGNFTKIIKSSEYPGDFYDNWGKRQGYLAYHAKWHDKVRPGIQGQRVRDRLSEFKALYDKIPIERIKVILGEQAKRDAVFEGSSIGQGGGTGGTGDFSSIKEIKDDDKDKDKDKDKTVSEYIEEYWWIAGIVLVLIIVMAIKK